MLGRLVLAVVALPLVGLGIFTGIVDPRHGSEVVGYPMLVLGAGLLVAAAWPRAPRP